MDDLRRTAAGGLVVLTFVAPSFGDNMTAKAIYAGVTYILLGVFYPRST